MCHTQLCKNHNSIKRLMGRPTWSSTTRDHPIRVLCRSTDKCNPTHTGWVSDYLFRNLKPLDLTDTSFFCNFLASPNLWRSHQIRWDLHRAPTIIVSTNQTTRTRLIKPPIGWITNMLSSNPTHTGPVMATPNPIHTIRGPL